MVQTLVIIESFDHGHGREDTDVQTYENINRLKNDKGVEVFRSQPDRNGGVLTEVHVEDCIIHKGIAVYFAMWKWDSETQSWA